MKNEVTKVPVKKENVLKLLPEDYQFNLSDFALFLSVMKVKEAYENVLSIILDEPDLKLKEVKAKGCAILTAWEHGNQKTGTNIYYSITLFLYANTGRSCLYRNRYRMI